MPTIDSVRLCIFKSTNHERVFSGSTMGNVMLNIFLLRITNNRRPYQSRHWFATLIVLILTVAHMPLASASLVSGGVVSGNLGPSIEHSYTFTANAGQSIVLRAGRIGGTLTPYIRLYNPSDGLVGDAGGGYRASYISPGYREWYIHCHCV